MNRIVTGLAFGKGVSTQTLTVPSEDRVFFALIGPEALARARTVMESVSGVQELRARPAFEANAKGPQASDKAAETRSAGDKTEERSTAKESAVAARPGNLPGYKIFQVTLTMAETNRLVGRLESQSGLVLRSLGKSLLSGAPVKKAPIPRPAGGVVQKPQGGGIPPMRTLVLVVLER